MEEIAGVQRNAWQIKRTYRLGIIGRLYTLPLEEKADTRDVLALPVAKRIHKLLQLGGSLDLEEDLIIVVRDLDVEVLRLTCVLWLLHVGRSVVGHSSGYWERALLAG